MSTVIHQEINFNVSPDRLYEVLLNSAQFSEVTGGAPTEISSEAGGSFSCFGGMIFGRNIELVPNERIVQAWRAGNWNEGVYSIVKFELKKQGNETQLVLDHSGFPTGLGEHLEAGWHENYWKPLEKYLG
ncbi:MAG: SRPBCC domain-containing protein [Paenisporosarcina sp.]